ncbi:putative uncharacterized protein [Odoribacter sp. CAG:788]|nr:putative uncharacterized protein [Odoribacter sp. CAG:788]
MSFENNSISVPFHWSGGVWAVTIVTLIVFAGAGFYIASLNWPTVMLWLKYLLTIVLLTTVIAGVSYTPIRLKANDKKITVSRLLGSLEVSLNEVIETRRISKSDIDNSIQTFGSGGLFGYLGRFKNGKLGSYTMYATDLNNLIFVHTNNKNYVLSCSRPQEFVKYVNLQLKQ